MAVLDDRGAIAGVAARDERAWDAYRDEGCLIERHVLVKTPIHYDPASDDLTPEATDPAADPVLVGHAVVAVFGDPIAATMRRRLLAVVVVSIGVLLSMVIVYWAVGRWTRRLAR